MSTRTICFVFALFCSKVIVESEFTVQVRPLWSKLVYDWSKVCEEYIIFRVDDSYYR